MNFLRSIHPTVGRVPCVKADSFNREEKRRKKGGEEEKRAQQGGMGKEGEEES